MRYLAVIGAACAVICALLNWPVVYNITSYSGDHNAATVEIRRWPFGKWRPVETFPSVDEARVYISWQDTTSPIWRLPQPLIRPRE